MAVRAPLAQFTDIIPPFTENRFPAKAHAGIFQSRTEREKFMNTGFAGQLHKRGVWGALLVLAGVALLAAQLSGEWEISLREWWPAIFVLVGIGKLLDYPNPKRVAKGVLLVSIGLWVLACKAQIWGLTFATSWPFVLIAVGAALVLSSFLRMRLQQSDTSHHAS